MHLPAGDFSLPQVWKDWCLIQGAYPYVGTPRSRPGRFRRWLERHALVIALVGSVFALAATSFSVVLTWFPYLLKVL
jgi:hypothetical protein